MSKITFSNKEINTLQKNPNVLVDYTLILRPEKLILGGGVMKQKQLFPLICEEFTKLMGNYVTTPDLNEYIVDPGLGDNAGIMGCLLLAREDSKE